MRQGRQFLRLMVAMIVMIVAYAVPSAAQAHEGHRHAGHGDAALANAQVVPSADPVCRTVARVSVLPKAAVVKGTLRFVEIGRGCCPSPCEGTCCGTMSCCASGILSDPAALPTLAFRHVDLISHDVNGRPGVGPEALPRPPRTLA